ncbi:MAG: DUF4870 domain-containing protein [Lentisphaerae bacterium]|nr:DUF4870 domain-containing protein [Lentisphaerota bacterium]
MENNEQGPVINPVENPAPAPVEVSNDDKMMAMLAHLLGGILGFIVPLNIWLIKKDQDSFVTEESKEALNFQLLMLIIMIIGGFVTCGVVSSIAWVVSVILGIIGGLKARDGIHYKYPFNLRLIK